MAGTLKDAEKKGSWDLTIEADEARLVFALEVDQRLNQAATLAADHNSACSIGALRSRAGPLRLGLHLRCCELGAGVLGDLLYRCDGASFKITRRHERRS